MPPKKNSAKENKKKEEAERRAREEAEAAELEERERLEREEQERKEREEKERQRAEEEARFIEETSRINEFLGEQKLVLEKWEQQRWEDKQWVEFTACRALPEPSNERAFNTYLSLSEERVKDHVTADIETTLGRIQSYLQLCSEMEDLQFGDGLPDPAESEVTRYSNTISRLHRLVLAELDQSSIVYMQESDKHVDTETYNMKVEAKIREGLMYSIWGNVVKNPRLKSFSFNDGVKLTLDIPKPLLLADTAIRVIQLPFDLLSPTSQSFHCTRTAPSTSLSTISKSSGKSSSGVTPGNQEELPSNAVEPASEDTDTQLDGAAPVITPQPPGDTVDSGEPLDGGPVKSGSVNGDPVDSGDPDGVAVEIGGVESGDVGDESKSDIVAPLAEDEVDLRASTLAIGPLLFDLLEMPPQPKLVNNWTIRKVVSSQVVHYKYPAETPKPLSSASDEGVAAVPSAPTPGSSSWPPVVVNMQLPEQFVFSEAPQLAQWDADNACWKTSGFKDIQCDLDERTISFQTFYFRPLAMIVDKYSNMPYLSWSLLPCGPDHTMLTLEGGSIKITVQIKGHESMLVGPSDVGPLQHIINQPMSARQLIKALGCAGVNFFPSPDADKYVSVTAKHHMMELSVYQSIALASCAVAFQWSRWNSEVSRKLVVLRALQGQFKSDQVDLDQLEWCTYVCGRRNYRIAVTEDSSDFPKELPEACEPHPSLYSTLKHEASGVAKDALKSISPMHCEAVKLWLTSVKLLTFS